jgi:aminopeptidase-like protein
MAGVKEKVNAIFFLIRPRLSNTNTQGTQLLMFLLEATAKRPRIYKFRSMWIVSAESKGLITPWRLEQ